MKMQLTALRDLLDLNVSTFCGKMILLNLALDSFREKTDLLAPIKALSTG